MKKSPSPSILSFGLRLFFFHLSHSLWANISGCFWQVNNSEIRQSILLPETKADMLCLSVLGGMKAYELRNTLTLQWCARLLPPDRPPNLWKTFQCDFDCYYFFYFCFRCWHWVQSKVQIKRLNCAGPLLSCRHCQSAGAPIHLERSIIWPFTSFLPNTHPWFPAFLLLD